MNNSSATAFRDALERRRQKAASPAGLTRIPFMLDTQLADELEALGRQAASLEARLGQLEDARVERDATPDHGDDIRASGDDASDLGSAIADTEAEFARVRAELEAKAAEASSARVDLVFRRASADEYERLLVAAGGGKVDTDAEAAYKFHNSLVERCFLRVELDGEDAGVKSWAHFARDADLSFGELDPIRAMVFAANKRGGNSIPFSLTPSKRTRTP